MKLFENKYYYILGCGTLCWKGESLEKAKIVFEDEQYDELFEVKTLFGVDVCERGVAYRDYDEINNKYIVNWLEGNDYVQCN